MYLYKKCMGLFMITKKMLKFLNSLNKENKSNTDNLRLNRIQKRIDRELHNLLVLAKEHPDILLGKTWLNEKGKPNKNSRLRDLILVIKYISPDTDVQLIMKNIDDEHEKLVRSSIK